MAATLAVTVVKTSDGSGYTGLTSAFINGKPFLYAANFNKGRVDAAAPGAQMYFTAGPNHGAGGLHGYLTSVSTELTEGNDQ